MVYDDLFKKYNLELNQTQLELLNEFYLDTIEKNKVLNLTAITEEKDFYIKHFLDSLLPANKLYGKILDVGTGGGFPGIPLIIYNPKLKITLLDSVQKKLIFLDEEIKKLCLNNIVTVHARCEDFANSVSRETFDFVLSRAVAKLNTLAEYCLPLTKIGGYFVAYKGENADEELKNAENAIKLLGGKIEKVEKYDIESNSRTMIYIKKIKLTPKIYPRGQNKPRLKPL